MIQVPRQYRVQGGAAIATLIAHLLFVAIMVDQLRFDFIVNINTEPFEADVGPPLLSSLGPDPSVRPPAPPKAPAPQAPKPPPVLQSPRAQPASPLPLPGRRPPTGASDARGDPGETLPAGSAIAPANAGDQPGSLSAAKPAEGAGAKPSGRAEAPSPYAQRLWRHLSKWRPSGRGLSGTAWIRLVPTADGRIGSLVLLRSSGNPALDQLALRAARSAQPLPRPPADLAGQAFDIPYQVGTPRGGGQGAQTLGVSPARTRA